MSRITAIRGMNDILPEHTPQWQAVETTLRQLMLRYGYQEIRLPIVEATPLFKRAIGEVTDIVEKEMYCFDDRSGEPLTLRPEGTAGCVRACLEHGLTHNQAPKLWYQGPMFRYERPQKGRYRQFHQFGVESFGLEGPDIDAELILLSARLWRELGISDAVSLEINSLGEPEARARFRADLVRYLEQFRTQLDDDSQRRLTTNPLRILDSKNPSTQQILLGAPQLASYLDEGSQQHFAALRARLDACGIHYTVNPNLVRGLDYYNKSVFEWVTTALGAQGTICAGGRYDSLVAQLGGQATPAVGFAIGLERLLLLLAEVQPVTLTALADIIVIGLGESSDQAALVIAEQLRDALPEARIVYNCGGGSFKSQFRKADKSGAQLAVVLGSDELADGHASIKWLRESLPQQTCALHELVSHVQSALRSTATFKRESV